MDRAKITLVDKMSGYTHVAKDINENKLDVSGFKLIIAMLGRAEVLDHHLQLDRAVDRTVQARNPLGRILITAPIPRPEDNERRIRRFHGLGHLVRKQCDRKRVIFSMLGERLTTPQGIKQHYFGPSTLNRRGRDEVRVYGLLWQVDDLEITIQNV